MSAEAKVRYEVRVAKALDAGKSVMQRGILTKVDAATEYAADLYGLTAGQRKRIHEALKRFAEEDS